MKEVKNYRIVAIFLAVVLSSTIPCDSLAAVSYTAYVNGRFGYSIKYPEFFKRCKPLPQNGDGITMAGKDAKLLMWGGYNVVYEDGKEMRKVQKEWRTRMSAVKANKKSLYFESRKGKKMTFHYTYFVGRGNINMELTCRKSKKKYFGKIVKKMMQSMRKNKRFY